MPNKAPNPLPASRKTTADQSQDVKSGRLETSADYPKRSEKNSPMSVLENRSLDIRPLRLFESRTGRQISRSPTGNAFHLTPPLAAEHPNKPPPLSSSRDGSASGIPSFPTTGYPSSLEQSGSRVVSHASTTSSLEPLGETFEVPTILLSPGPNERHSIAEIPSLSPSNDRTRSPNDKTRSHGRTQSNVVPTSPRLLGASDSNYRHAGPGRSRSKSDTTMMEPMVRDLISSSIPFASLMSTNAHFMGHRDHCLSPILSPRFAENPSARPTSPLVADLRVAKSRLLVTKTHCYYPRDFLSFQSCLLGFQVVFHPCNPKARIKHSEITLSMFPEGSDVEAENPIIKAIYPTGGILHRQGEKNKVHRHEGNTIGLSLGVDPYGKMGLQHTRSRSHEEYTSPYLLGSGLESNTLLLTMTEDPVAHGGITPSLDFAVLLYLPSQTTQAFEAQLTVKASPGGEMGAALRGLWMSPKIWRLKYDGMTELGRNIREVHPDGSKSIFLPSDHPDAGDADGEKDAVH